MSETFEPVYTFQPPNEAMLDLLRALEWSSQELARISGLCHIAYTREEMRGFGELTPLQVDRLLSR